ncbi:MAG: hypothetical protein ACHP84_15930 [Caulobacterales bacterium]
MTPFEYLLLFAAVILGLAICDLAVSVHRLLAAGARVKWDWLAPLAAVVAFLKIVTQWWTWYGAKQLATGMTFEMFLGVLVSTVLLFLVAAEALPDEIGGEAIDLAAYYASASRRFWLLFTIQWVLGTGVSIWVQVAVTRAHLDLMTPVWLVAPVAISLVLVRNRWWHTIGLLGFTAVYLWQFFGQSLAG